jgi:hypothetical protein
MRKANSPIDRQYKRKQLKMSPTKVLESLFGTVSDIEDKTIMPRSPLRRVRPTLEHSTAPVEDILPQLPTLEVSVNDMVKAANVLYHEEKWQGKRLSIYIRDAYYVIINVRERI